MPHHKNFTMHLRNILILFLLTATCVNAQTDKGKIDKKSLIQSEIEPSAKHRYSIQLEKDKFVIVHVAQLGADVEITTFDPEGKMLESFDSPNGSNGIEHVTFSTDIPGNYALEISSLEETESGTYSISIIETRERATTPEGKVDEIFSAWDTDHTPGASVAVLKDGEVIFSKGYGMATLEYDVPITPATIFHIASVSKQFTVFSILLLQNEGKLSLDDDIRKYIPEVPDFGTTITLRHLASHTSGLRDQWNLLAMAGWRLDDVITTEQVLKLVSHQKELNFQPGEQYTYCNTGFTLLAEVVARVSGKSFPEFTDEEIFKPLGMNNTLFYDDHERIVPNRAYSYGSSDNGYKKRVLSYAIAGATSLFTTVEDLSLWADNFKTLKVGNAGIVEEMNTPYVLNNGETFGGALGQFVGEYKGLKEIQHGGADAGYRTYLARYPDQNVAVSVFSNDGGFNSGAMAHKVTDVFLSDLLVEDVKSTNSEMVDVPLDDVILERYIGNYEMEAGFIAKITSEDQHLFFQTTGGKNKLLARNENTFYIPNADVVFNFEDITEQKAATLRVEADGDTYPGKRIAPFDPTIVDLSEYEGEYFSDELFTAYHFRAVDGKLMAQHIRHSDFELIPEKPDAFRSTAWFFGQVEFLRNEKNEITGCRVSSGRVQNLKFKKVGNE